MTSQHEQHSFNRVLVPLDGSLFSEYAIPVAQSVSGADAELILCQIVSKGDSIRGLTGRVIVSAEKVTRALLTGIEAYLARAQHTWLGDRSNVRNVTVVGDSAEAILAIADRENVDLIVMASHGHGALQRWVIGSVADRVVRTSPIPVLIMRPNDEDFVAGRERPIRRLIVPYDGSELAAQALPFAKRLALTLQVPMVLVKVTELASNLQSAMFYGVAFSPQLYEEVLREARSADEQMLASVASDFRHAGVSVNVLLIDGLVAESIVTVSEPNDLIVMTSHGRGGLRRMVMGSVAEKLVRQGPVPVLLVPAVVREEDLAVVTQPEAQLVPTMMQARL